MAVSNSKSGNGGEGPRLKRWGRGMARVKVIVFGREYIYIYIFTFSFSYYGFRR